MSSPRPRAPLLSPSALGHQTDTTTRPQGQGLGQMQAQAAIAGSRSPWLGASQPHSGLVSEGGSPTLDDDGEGGIDESGGWADGAGDGGDAYGYGQPDGEGSQPKRERRPMQTVIDGQQQQDDVVVSQGGGQAPPSGRARRPATGRDHGNAKRRRHESAAQADGSEESSSSGGSGSGSGSGSRSSRSSSSSQSSSTSSSSDSDDERRDEDPAAAAARRSHQGHLLQTGHPMDVEAEAAEAEAAAAAAQSAPNQPLFHCVTTNIDLILQLLHAVKLEKKEQMCRVYIASQGMKVVTSLEQSRSVCAKAYLKKDLFSQYTLRRTNFPQRAGAPAQQRANDYTCYLSLANMIDCMQLLGGSKDAPGAAPPVMHFKIEEEQHPLIISLDGSDGCGHTVLTECVLQVLEKDVEEEDGFQIGRDKLMACILNGPQLRYAFSELDLADAEELAMHVRLDQDANGNQLPTMRMTTKGHGGLEVTCDFSRDPQSNLVFENNFEIFKGPFKLSYALRHLRPCIRALAKADMSNIRINAQGLLSIQHVMTTHAMTFWIEFFIAAREAPETDEGMPLPLPDGPLMQAAVPPEADAIQLPDEDATHNNQQHELVDA